MAHTQDKVDGSDGSGRRDRLVPRRRTLGRTGIAGPHRLPESSGPDDPLGALLNDLTRERERREGTTPADRVARAARLRQDS